MTTREQKPDQIVNEDFNAFIDFYNQHNVIPVSQNIEEIAEFSYRRNYLYTRLGSPLFYFKNRKVIEFGPGGGFNAIATSAYKPELYVFVDASKASLIKLHHHYENNKFNADKVEIINSNIYNYQDPRKYDYVIIEGTICGQSEPSRMLKKVSTFVKDGGTLITTTTSATSFLSEICRKLLKVKIEDFSPNFESQVSIGASIFKSHLENLGTSTRPINDWVIDVILNDWQKGNYIFTIIDAIESIGNEFDFYNSFPSFFTDDRWYKKVTNNNNPLNSIVINQYSNISAGLLDYRVSIDSIFKIKTNILELEKLSRFACDIHDNILFAKNYDRLSEFFRILLEINALLPVEFHPTKLAIQDFISSLPKFIDNPKNSEFSEFSKWWGRGQQYVSFIKRPF